MTLYGLCAEFIIDELEYEIFLKMYTEVPDKIEGRLIEIWAEDDFHQFMLWEQREDGELYIGATYDREGNKIYSNDHSS